MSSVQKRRGRTNNIKCCVFSNNDSKTHHG
jgi:hypothetical protein